MKKLYFLFVISLFLAIPCAAQVIIVDANGTGDYPTIQAAINATNTGDIVELQPGTYTGEGNRDIFFSGLAITVRSTDPNDSAVVAATVIDSQSSPVPGQTYTGFSFDSGEDYNTVLEGLTITGGFSVNISGAISFFNSSPTIRNCIIQGNVGYSGGGIVCFGGSPMVTNCVIKDNESLAFGGGIACFNGGDLQITNCTITGNSARDLSGDGIYCFDSSPTITNCILWANTPQEVYVNSGTPVVTYCDVQGGYIGIGNIDTDPCFASFDTNGDPNMWDFHLQSAYGRWDPNSQTWVSDSNTSLCIDAGEPTSDWTGELWPHGKRINIGAYGGTPQASMSLSDAGNVADLNNDGFVDFTDFFTDKWLYEEILLPEDLNRDGIVNFADYAIFANNLKPPPPPPIPATAG